MKPVVIALLFFTNNAYYARECRRITRDDGVNQEEPTTTIASTTVSAENEEFKEIIKSETANTDLLLSITSKQGPESQIPVDDEESSKIGHNKAYACSQLTCPIGNNNIPVCACNFVTGNVASFKNKCDVEKHNCRFDTNFQVILNEICPWEFAFRRGNKEYDFDYHDPKYYN